MYIYICDIYIYIYMYNIYMLWATQPTLVNKWHLSLVWDGRVVGHSPPMLWMFYTRMLAISLVLRLRLPSSMQPAGCSALGWLALLWRVALAACHRSMQQPAPSLDLTSNLPLAMRLGGFRRRIGRTFTFNSAQPRLAHLVSNLVFDIYVYLYNLYIHNYIHSVYICGCLCIYIYIYIYT